MNEYKNRVREERKKFAYTFVGAAIVVHVLFLLSTYFAIAVGLSAGVALLLALWRETSGRRFGMSLAFVLALAGHGGVMIYDYFFGVDITEEAEKVVRFQPPPPILEKN